MRGYARECTFNDDKGAIHDFTVAAQLNPNDAEAYTQRGFVRMHMHDDATAILDFTQAIAAKPNADAYWKRGYLLLQNKAYDRALADFEALVGISPKFAFAYERIASIRATCPDAKFRDGKQAVRNATKACELTDWKDADCLDTLAAAYAEAGDFDSAIRWEQKAMDGQPILRSTHRDHLDSYKSHRPRRSE